LSSFDSLIKIYFTFTTLKNPQRTCSVKEESHYSKTLSSPNNVLPSVAVGVCWRVKIQLHKLDIDYYRRQNQLNVLFSRASVTKVAVCHSGT